VASQLTVVSPQVSLQAKARLHDLAGQQPWLAFRPRLNVKQKRTIPGNRDGNPAFYPRFGGFHKVQQHPGASGRANDDRGRMT